MNPFRSVYNHFPHPVKNLLRGAKARLAGAPPSPVADLARLYRREWGKTVVPAVADQPRKVLFNSQFTWPFGYAEYTLATALQLRGHQVSMIACGGLPAYCELETASQQRPACAQCGASLTRVLNAFGLPRVAHRDFLTPEDMADAERLARETPIPILREMQEAGVPIGELAFLNLFSYFKGYPFVIEGKIEDVFRRCAGTAFLQARGMSRLLDAVTPDIVCSVNGKFVQWAPIVILARRRGIPFITWEDLNLKPCGVIFEWNGIAHEMRVDSVWENELKRPFREEEKRAIREHFNLWAAGANSPWVYYDDTTIRDAGDIRRALGLPANAPIVSLFPNLCWDSTSVGFEHAFSSMYHWIQTVVEYARSRPGIAVVVRAHPAEAKLPPEFRSSTPVCDFVRRECSPLTPNVFLIEGTSPISSYGLGAISSVVMTYTTTLGIEFALQGIRPWVAANAYYARKGFTLDIDSPQHLRDLLDKGVFDNRLTEEQVELAERLAYIVRFRKVFSFPFLEKSGRFAPPSFSVFALGGDARIEALCDRVLNAKPFIDIG